jgi:hypothetical protein
LSQTEREPATCPGAGSPKNRAAPTLPDPDTEDSGRDDKPGDLLQRLARDVLDAPDPATAVERLQVAAADAAELMKALNQARDRAVTR